MASDGCRELVLYPRGKQNSKVLFNGKWHRLPGTPKSKKAREAFCDLLLGEGRLRPPGRQRMPVYQLHRATG